MTEAIEQKIERLILGEKDVIPVLKELSFREKKDLVPFLKKLVVRVFEIKTITRELTSTSTQYLHEQTHTDQQKKLLFAACFVCYNKTDTLKLPFEFSSFVIGDDCFQNILPWFTPKWFSEYVNEVELWRLGYLRLMQLSKAGHLKPSRELLAEQITGAIIETSPKGQVHKRHYQIENLCIYEETLKEHIWLLFEEVSAVNDYYAYTNLENYNGRNEIWIETFHQLVNAEKLDRKRVLKETILTSTKGFNKTLSGWFSSLMDVLSPTNEEVVILQDEFFSSLQSPHSKVVSTTLKYFKKIVGFAKFRYEDFIECTGFLLSSETKGVVKSTLLILEKIAKNRDESRASVSMACTQAFIIIDDKIQLKAAKIIQIFGEPTNEELRAELEVYDGIIFSEALVVLKDFIDEKSDEATIDQQTLAETNFLGEENQLPCYESFDDLLFFVSQSIDNNEPYHIDQLLSALPKLNLLINTKNVSKLEPILNRALKLSISTNWSKKIGELETYAALYINDFARMLMEKFPREMNHYQVFRQERHEQAKQSEFYKSHLKHVFEDIEKQPVYSEVYQIHRFLFLKSKEFLKEKVDLELLSTPTHVPCWIDPVIFLKRLALYEHLKKKVSLVDYQIAMGRISSSVPSSVIETALEQLKTPLFKKIIRYHFGMEAISKECFERPELWLQSVLTRNNLEDFSFFQNGLSNALAKERGLINWKIGPVEYEYKDFDYNSRKQITKIAQNDELIISDKDEMTDALSGYENRGDLNENSQPSSCDSYYKFFNFKKELYVPVIRTHDEIKVLYLSPHNPSPLLSQLTKNILKESSITSDGPKTNVVNLLKGLFEIWHKRDYGQATYLFLATSMLCNEKVARELVCELWIDATAKNQFDTRLFGEILGKLEHGNYAPIKRFSDLLPLRLFNVSKLHNEKLFDLLDAMLGEMDTEPIRGLNKVLDIFKELKNKFLKKSMSEKTKENLQSWVNTKSLAVIAKKILSLV